MLYQERQDPPLLRQRLSPGALEDVAIRRKFSLGELPPPPDHTFIGRSRELLALERLLCGQSQDSARGRARSQYAVFRGVGGEGKTTLAVEFARWMVRTQRFRRAAFVSLEQYSDAKGAADAIGRQLVGAGYTASMYNDWREALLPIARELKDKLTIIVVDNVESLLAGYGTGSVSDLTRQVTSLSADSLTATAQVADAPRTEPAEEIFALCQALLDAHPATRIVFTSRELLPKPFANRDRVIPLDRLSRQDAVELVSRVLRRREYDEQGNTPADIAELVEAVNRHARALTLLAREVALSGVSATTETLRPLMAKLEQQNPGDRENSLYASVGLSLRRLPPELREQAKALAVFHGGAHLGVLAALLGLDKQDFEAAQRLADALSEVGLAKELPYGHLRLDPALPSYLLSQMDATELTLLTARWTEAMQALTEFLYQQQFQDAQLAAQLTLLELPNLLVMINHTAGALQPEEVVKLAGSLETLLARLGRPQALALAVSVRAAAARQLGEWSHAQFLNASKNIERLLEQGDLQSAYAAAQQLLERCLSAGAESYSGAAYDIAMAYFNLGRVLNMGGAAEEALSPLAEAHHRLQAFADATILPP